MFRSFYYLLAILGIVLVVVLVLLRRDLVREGRTGPRWKRKLLAAGLVLLGMLGVTWDWSRSQTPWGGSVLFRTDFDVPIPRGQHLERTPHWQHLTAVWHEAEEVGSGRRGSYPFNARGKQRLLDELTTVTTNLKKLQDAQVLTAPEAGLLEKELVLLTQRVNAMRPTEERDATCYMPVRLAPINDSFDRLADRLPLLCDYADSEDIRPEVLAKTLDTIEADLAVLDGIRARPAPSEANQAKTIETSRDAKDLVRHIKKTLAESTHAVEDGRRFITDVNVWRSADFAAPIPQGRSLQETEPWKHLTTVWQEAEAVGSGLRGDYPFDENGRRRILDELAVVTQNLKKLRNAKLLSAVEYDILAKELLLLTQRVQYHRPIENRHAKFDETTDACPLENSFDNLAKRLSLLKQQARDKRIRAAILQKVLATIEADIAALSLKKETTQLDPGQHKDILALRRNVEATAAEVRRLLKESP